MSEPAHAFFMLKMARAGKSPEIAQRLPQASSQRDPRIKSGDHARVTEESARA